MRIAIIGLAALPAIGAAIVAVLSARGTGGRPALADEGKMPDLGGAVGWLNTARLTGGSLRGKVVLVDFWTYTCINSLRPLPYVKAWAEKYKDAGLVVIGVHTPEFSVEKERANVQRAVRGEKPARGVFRQPGNGVGDRAAAATSTRDVRAGSISG